MVDSHFEGLDYLTKPMTSAFAFLFKVLWNSNCARRRQVRKGERRSKAADCVSGKEEGWGQGHRTLAALSLHSRVKESPTQQAALTYPVLSLS